MARTEARARAIETFKQGFAELAGRTDVSIEELRRYDDALWNQFISEHASVEEIEANGVPCILVTAPESGRDRVVVWFHGGGFAVGSAAGRRGFAADLSRSADCSVLLADYRLAPEHPFPAALQDAIAAHRWAVERVGASAVVLGGESAGGGLAVSALLYAKEQQLPLPTAAVAMSPIVDWTLTAESFTTNARNDLFVNIPMLSNARGMFLDGVESNHPMVSPIFGDLSNLPPLMVLVGSDEVLRDDATKLVVEMKAAGSEAELHVFDDMFHLWPMFASILPEGRLAIDDIGSFVVKHSA